MAPPISEPARTSSLTRGRRAAAHDDDPLAVDLGERGDLLEAVHAVEPFQVREERVRSLCQLHLEVDVRAVAGRMEVDVADVRVVIREHLRDRRHHARAIRGRDHDCVKVAHRLTDGIAGGLPTATSDFRITDSVYKVLPPVSTAGTVMMPRSR